MCFSRLGESWDKADGAERLPRSPAPPHASFIWTNVIKNVKKNSQENKLYLPHLWQLRKLWNLWEPVRIVEEDGLCIYDGYKLIYKLIREAIALKQTEIYEEKNS